MQAAPCYTKRMNRIHLLSDELISQIAAGEVIERPASAVKELVENSLDAGATAVSVEIEEGGLRKIRVVDNGHGMGAEDARMAFTRHATSKIASIDDLFQIRSLGFRGEALASIGSIARVSLRTRTEEERVGTLVEMDGGKLLMEEECACDTGTEVTVLSLFEHTPARKKYMKLERTEYGHIFDLLVAVSLAHPGVAFRLMRDGESVFSLAAGQSIKERVRDLFGGETANALIPVTYQQSNLMISGFVGKPELARSGKKYQFLFVNGRAVEDRLVGHAVKEAFHSLLMHEKYPWYLLNIEMDPALVDVNVHPRKWEVKFVNTQEMYRAVFGSVSHALQNNMLSPGLSGAGREAPLRGVAVIPRATAAERSFAPVQEELVSVEKSQVFEVKGLRLRPLAQIANSYIVAESEEGLVLIDQHAAHERVRYDRMMKALEKEEILKQPLLTPLSLDLGIESARLVTDYAEDFAALGFELEPFGGSTFLLRAVPQGIEKKEPERVVRELLSTLTTDYKNNAVKNVREALLTMAACRGAIKFGDSLTLMEMEALIKDMEGTENCTHCPHGRPALLSFSFDHLETLFKRKNF